MHVSASKLVYLVDPGTLLLERAASASERYYGYPFGHRFLDCLVFAEDKLKGDYEVKQRFVRITLDLMPATPRNECREELDSAMQSGAIEAIETILLLQFTAQFRYALVSVCEVNHHGAWARRGNEAASIWSEV